MAKLGQIQELVGRTIKSVADMGEEMVITTTDGDEIVIASGFDVKADETYFYVKQ